MNAVQFPEMLSANKTVVIKDKEATKQNLSLLLQSYKKTLLGDPHFGVNLRRLLYESNNTVLQDLVIDDLQSAITTFMPQVRVSRSDIAINSEGNTLTAVIRAQNLLDFQLETYHLNLLDMEELQ